MFLSVKTLSISVSFIKVFRGLITQIVVTQSLMSIHLLTATNHWQLSNASAGEYIMHTSS